MLELQGHGGNAVLRGVLSRCLELGARPAEAGEFTLRAYLNGKIDLAQAEAVADLINAGSAANASAAANSLHGAFSRQANVLAGMLVEIRADMEAAMDFADEDIHADVDFTARLAALQKEVGQFLAQCEQGAKLAGGMTVVIAGSPNVGKSSLLNRLCREDAAIVAARPGTTRDLISRDIDINGMTARVIDTAGLRDAGNVVEEEGINRAAAAMAAADLLLLVGDGRAAPSFNTPAAVLQVRNKIDLQGLPAGRHNGTIYVSAKTGEGLQALRAAIAEAGGMRETAPPFTARARHLAAVQECLRCLQQAQDCGAQTEIAASWLAAAHAALSSLTGVFDDENLLGEIFSRFCVGK